ncbi:MAG TPA: mannose-1-phosphate guanylyltransferase [Thermoanaerobaculia bacterium]|nr:mannose-1-phosphate guanylyltransferase [Thermoanaerobaculia bacterium]
MTRAAVILAGGAGTRLRPLSSDENPKQFLKLFDERSLLQLTFARVSQLLPAESIFVSTNVQYADKCREHLPEMPPENVLAEPARRNTAPAIALCTFAIEQRLGPCAVSFLASDHYIANEPEFVRVLDRAYRFAETHDELVTIGIHPTDPNTGYGYLEVGETLEDEVQRVRSFREKPDLATAEEFLRAGNYAWNAGMFVWRSEVFRRELTAAAPEIVRVSESTYEEMPSISIDYALMEKAPRVATLRGDFGWSDVGTFDALRAVGVDVDGLLARSEQR